MNVKSKYYCKTRSWCIEPQRLSSYELDDISGMEGTYGVNLLIHKMKNSNTSKD